MTTPPTALVFDWDNTLVDTWKVIHSALEVTFQAMDREPWTLEETRTNVRASAREAFPKLFGVRAEEATKIFYQTFERCHLDILQPLKGAELLLAYLKNREDIFVSILSNKRGDLLRREITHLKWGPYFQNAVGAEDAHIDKPAPEAMIAALEGSGLKPSGEVWMVGDTDMDMVCASNSGCNGILLRPSPMAPGEFGDYEPKAYFSSCENFLRYLSKLE
jgi:phosphoglycolate phosphatase